jgi:hypothetical protein
MRQVLPGLFVVAFTGCSDPAVEPQPAPNPDGAMCQDLATTALAMDEASSLGFSADDALAVAGGSHTGTLVYADGSSTAVTVSVESRGSPRFIHRAWGDDGGDGEVMPMLADTGGGSAPGDSGTGDTGGAGTFDDPCHDVLALDVTFRIATADGAFDEGFDTVLEAAAADDAQVYAALDLAHLGGSFTLDSSGYDAVSAWIDARFDASGAHGIVQGQGSATDGDVAFAENIDIGAY